MNLSGKYFVYDGISSRAYNLRFLHIDTTPYTQTSGEISYKTNFYKNRKRNVIAGISWEDSPLSVEVEIISDREIDFNNKRKIEKWLFNSSNYKKLYVDRNQDTEMERINGKVLQQYLECTFTNPTAIVYANKTFGWKATLTASSPMALQDEIEFEVSDFNNAFVINADTDIDDYIYPDIEIKTSDTCTSIKITNLTDESVMYLKSDSRLKSKNLYVNGNTGSIYDDTSESYFDLVEGQRFFKLLPTVNDVKIESDGLTKVKFIWQNARWFR